MDVYLLVSREELNTIVLGLEILNGSYSNYYCDLNKRELQEVNELKERLDPF